MKKNRRPEGSAIAAFISPEEERFTGAGGEKRDRVRVGDNTGAILENYGNIH